MVSNVVARGGGGGGGGGGTIKPYLFAWPKRWLPRMFYRKKNIL